MATLATKGRAKKGSRIPRTRDTKMTNYSYKLDGGNNSNNRTFIQRPFKVSIQKRSLRWPMMLNIAMNKYFQSVRKTKYSKPKESPEADPHTRGTNQQIPLDSWQMIGVQSLFTLG